MARLIPSFMDGRTPPGERDVFNLLSTGPDDWVVMHSLDLAPWNRGLRTEIDFVVIIPDSGILCVEIKSHENIGFDGHRWYPESISRSPFKQAIDGRYTFRRRLAELAPIFNRVPVVHCVIFPRSPFELGPNLSVQSWELMDSRAFRAYGSGNEFCDNLKTRMGQGIAADQNISPMRSPFSHDQIDDIVQYCVPVQKLRPLAREEITRREAEIEKILLEQQKPVLQIAALNDRMIVSGGAGTGKTLIAMEVARRAAEKGRRVALLCFNQLIGDWMKRQIEQAGQLLPNLVVGRTIRVMAEMTEIEIPSDASQEYWNNELPQKLEERLTDPDFQAAAAFDYLILDEAQDLLTRPRLWQCLAQFLAGGLDKGSFAIFGDFDYQVLSQRDTMHRTLAALSESSRPVQWKLSENCRNYRIVGDTAVKLAGISDSVYSGYLRSGGGIHNYNVFFYDSEQAQLDKLCLWIKEFKTQGYKPSEIILLSFRDDDSSSATRLKKAGYKLRPAWQAGDNQMPFASVHAFKGMESKIVILTDIILENHDFHRDLFYTGMTRATESVRVLCDKSSQETISMWLSGKADS